MALKNIIVAMLAATGLAGGTAARLHAAPTSPEIRQAAAVKNGQSARDLEADISGRFAGGMARAIFRDYGHTPYEWGISRECARMVRKNRQYARRRA